MGAFSSKSVPPNDPSSGGPWVDLGFWKRQPVRVRSAAHRLTEWDDLGDKNAAYYTGQRFTTIDPTLYAVPVCNTHAHGTWWKYNWDHSSPNTAKSKEEEGGADD